MSDNLIQGWRRFNYEVEGETRLIGGYRKVWETSELVAECTRVGRGKSQDQLPIFEGEILTYEQATAFEHLSEGYVDCHCGIYIAREIAELDDQGYNQLPIVAFVTGYGAYEEKELGWKVSHCRIEHLWVDTKTINNSPHYRLVTKGLKLELEEKYQVKCDIGFDYVPVCQCGRTDSHSREKWITQDGKKVKVCQMSTSHIINAGKALERNYSINSRVKDKWIKVFKAELEYRAARLNNEGRLQVHF